MKIVLTSYYNNSNNHNKDDDNNNDENDNSSYYKKSDFVNKKVNSSTQCTHMLTKHVAFFQHTNKR